MINDHTQKIKIEKPVIRFFSRFGSFRIFHVNLTDSEKINWILMCASKSNAKCMRSTSETIAKYAVDANMFRLGYVYPKKDIQVLHILVWRAKPPPK